MHEKLRQFERESKLEIFGLGARREIWERALEKYAELIVRECIKVVGPEDSYTDEWFKAKADSVQKIKTHFGVE